MRPGFLWTYLVFFGPEKRQLWRGDWLNEDHFKKKKIKQPLMIFLKISGDWLNEDHFKKEKNHATSHELKKNIRRRENLLKENLLNY